MDVFISYARKDDRAASELIGSKGLVSSLHDRLLANFEDLGPPRPPIFRDTKQIEALEQFEPRLGVALAAAKLLIVVLSRNWLESEWCRRELDTFVKHWQQRGEEEQAIKERIAVVRKHAIPAEAHPAWLQGQAGYDLISVDPENREENEFFDSDTGKVRNSLWFERTRRLAKDLRRRFNAAGDDGDETGPFPASASSVGPDSMAVFVARPALDMEQSYNTLIEELARRGFRVVPDPAKPLWLRGDEALAAIDAALAQAKVSIHLLGEKRGYQPEDGKPIVQQQLERAAEKVASAAAAAGAEGQPFHRLIWAPRVVPGSPDAAASRDLFQVLAKHSQGAGAEPAQALCTGDKLDGDTLTKFVQFVLRHLAEIARHHRSRPSQVREGARIYIQHDDQDAVVAETVAESLELLGFVPLLPVIGGDAIGRKQIHRDSLQLADAVVLCWANAGPVWVRATASELRRWQDLDRSKAFDTRTVVFLPPPIADKDRLRKFPPRTDIDDVIDASAVAAVRSEHLGPLLRRIVGEKA